MPPDFRKGIAIHQRKAANFGLGKKCRAVIRNGTSLPETAINRLDLRTVGCSVPCLIFADKQKVFALRIATPSRPRFSFFPFGFFKFIESIRSTQARLFISRLLLPEDRRVGRRWNSRIRLQGVHEIFEGNLIERQVR